MFHHRPRVLPPLLCLLAMLLPGVARAAEVEHPRLFLTADRVAEIQKAVQVEGSTHARMYAGLKARVDGDMAETYDSGVTKYSPSYKAREAAMLTHTFSDEHRKMLMTGVAHSGNYNEGWTSLLLHLAPDDQLPYYKYFYDRHMGDLAGTAERYRYDGQRVGTVWALLYYPEDIKAADGGCVSGARRPNISADDNPRP